MTDGAAILAAIAADPDEDTPRLAYADWLDEHGDPARAAFIRLQVSGPEDGAAGRQRYDRERELLDAHEATWTADLGPFDREKVFVEFSRGFPEQLTVSEGTPADFRVLAALPGLRRLGIEHSRLTPAVLRTIAGLRQLDALRISYTPFRAPWAGLLEPLPCWTYVRVDDAADGPLWEAAQERRIGKVTKLRPAQRRAAGLRFLAAVAACDPWRPIRRATSASLSQVGATDAELRLLAQIPELEDVHIFQGRETVAGLRHLSRLPSLKSVYLGRANAESLVPLTRCTTLEKLVYWPENLVSLGDAGVAGLERLTNLRTLALRASNADGGFGDETVRRLAPLRELRSLNLQLRELEDDNCLAAVAGLTKLERLEIEGRLGDDALRHFAGLTNLSFLSVRGNDLTDAGLRPLAGLKKLRTVFAQSGWWPDCPPSRITAAGAAALAARLPGVTVILDRHVFKSSRPTFVFRRSAAGFVSALFPTHWPDRQGRDDDRYVWLTEDGWETVGGWSGGVVGPAEMYLYVSDADRGKSAVGAMDVAVQNNAHLNPRVLKRDVVRLTGRDTASCVYRNNHGQYLVAAVGSGGRCAVLRCEAPPARFAEFLPLFRYVARSLRVGKSAATGVGDEVEVAVSEL